MKSSRQIEKKKLQAKDIPERPILEFLNKLKSFENAHRYPMAFGYGENSIYYGFPLDEIPARIVLAKMGALIRRGLVEGCTCGCRGDFRITDKGRERLSSGELF